MDIPINQFIKVIPKSAVYYIIRVTEENMKYIYQFLKDNGCEYFPDERQAAGKIWIFDPDVKDCIEYTDDDFNEIEWIEYDN